MEIYVDVLFFINFFIDFIILFVTGTFMSKKTFTLRHVLGAVISAVYAILMFMPDFMLLYTVFSKVCAAFVIVAVSFVHSGFKSYLKAVCTFFLISFLFGGCVSAAVMYAGLGAIVKNGIIYFDFSIVFLLICICICFVLSAILRGVIMRRMHSKTTELIITKNNKSARLTALYDSGNLLTDALGAAVIVCSIRAVAGLVPEEIRDKLLRDDIAGAIECQGADFLLRIISYQGVGSGGVMAGFVPDCVVYIKNRRTVQVDNVVIGLVNNLSDDEGFEAIMGGMCYA